MAEPAQAAARDSLLDRTIQWSIQRRFLVVLASLSILAYATWAVLRMPVDVFPDLSAPTVTVITEAHGLAPQEVETIVTVPIESSVNGGTGVRRVRSSSGTGISIVWVEFDWGTDIYKARQIVTEKLRSIESQLPEDMGSPTLAPISSVMGEILFVGLVSDRHSKMELRDMAQWDVRRRLRSISGVAQIMVMGGDLRQYQILVHPEKLIQYHLSMNQVIQAFTESSQNSTGGFLVQGSQESVIRGIGRVSSLEGLADIPIAVRNSVPIVASQVADIQLGAALKRGEASVNAKHGIVIGVLKQPEVNTVALTNRVDAELRDIASGLPEGMRIEHDLLRQAEFIETAVDNVSTALRDGAILVALILFLFLWNWRTTVISLTAMPMSLALTVIVMEFVGLSINTMTLGGLTIAIGAIVDDAIIDVENVFRRLRERRASGSNESTDLVIYRASREIRGAIVFATMIVGLVYLPLFFLGGVEGRLLVPLGMAYLVALFSSLIVALTLTPALCSFILGGKASLDEEESRPVRVLKRLYRAPLELSLRRPYLVVLGSTLLLAASLVVVPFLGRTFLPKFNEGALTISAVTLPGTSLATSDTLGTRVEEVLLTFPEVVSTARRTGRSELDEHAQEIYAAEIDVRLAMKDRSKAAFLGELRSELSKLSGITTTVGQPISHRIDHMLSGTRAAIAVKIFGENLNELRRVADQIEEAIRGVEGAVDVSIEQPLDVPQLTIRFLPKTLKRYGTTPGQMAEALEHAYTGAVVGHIIDGQRSHEVLVRYADDHRSDMEAIGDTLIDTPIGTKVPLRMLAEIHSDAGPSTVTRENGQRKLVVMANVGSRDLGSVVDDIRKAVAAQVSLPQGVYVAYGGQFESEQSARKRITALGLAVILGIFALLIMALGSARLAVMTMANLPLALIGGIAAVVLGGGVLSVGSLIGFITLFGIATRNGLILISHYEHLIDEEGASLQEALTRGSMERLSPVLMTALSAALALVPLVLAGHQPGNEIQAPMGIVILGGLLTSTALNLLVVPALYSRFGRRKPREAAAPPA